MILFPFLRNVVTLHSDSNSFLMLMVLAVSPFQLFSWLSVLKSRKKQLPTSRNCWIVSASLYSCPGYWIPQSYLFCSYCPFLEDRAEDLRLCWHWWCSKMQVFLNHVLLLPSLFQPPGTEQPQQPTGCLDIQPCRYFQHGEAHQQVVRRAYFCSTICLTCLTG